jgi:hypothetical protein
MRKSCKGTYVASVACQRSNDATVVAVDAEAEEGNNARLPSFREIVRLATDCKTRFISKCAVLSSLLKHRQAVCAVLDSEPSIRGGTIDLFSTDLAHGSICALADSLAGISYSMWDEVAQLDRVLRYLNDASQVLGGNYPTASLVPFMLARLQAVLRPLEGDMPITISFKKAVLESLKEVVDLFRDYFC